MKSRKRHALQIAAVICLLSVVVSSCKKADTYTEMPEETETEKETLCLEEQTEQDTENMFFEPEEDTTAQNLLCLKNADTRALVGLSFGDALDYDGYEMRRWSEDEVCYYRQESCAYADVGLVFGGRGNGFSGLKQYWSGNFFGIILGEDTIDAFTDVLGEPDTWEEKASGRETALWAVWNFEDAMLSVRINEGKVRAIVYLANGTIADAQETPSDETDLGKDCQTVQACVEAVYNWSACRPDGGLMELENGQLGYNWSAFRSSSEEGYAMYSPYDDEYDAGKVEAFVQDYLLSQGIDKKTPDGTVHNQNGDLFVEYYVDKENAEYCFIVHLWGEYWLDYDNGISAYQDEVYCTTHTLKEEDIAGYVLCEQDTDRQTAQERLYDIWGKKVAEVSYEYIPEMPFPLVTQEWNFTAGFSPVPLIRNQKMWFYKEQAQFDVEEKFCAYANVANKESDGSEYFPYSCRTVYDTDGRLQAIQEELLEEDIENKWGWWDDSIDYSGQVAFDYDTDGIIKHAEYVRSSYTHGTTDSSGTIDYDENGRMIENDYYITHGGHTDIFLYEGDSTMPWCVLHWCSFEPGFENIYLFLPKS